MSEENGVQAAVDHLLTDPDKDAANAPAAPQTIGGEPTSDRPGQHTVPDDEED